MAAHALVDAVDVNIARADHIADVQDLTGVRAKMDGAVRHTKDIAIYFAANSASTLAISGPRVAAAAFRSTAATSAVYALGFKAATALGVHTSPAIALATAVAAAACARAPPSGAAATVALATPSVAGKALLFTKALPVGALFAAEYAAFVSAKRAVTSTAASSGAVDASFARSPLGRFALGAASITAITTLCALCAPARALALCRPALPGGVAATAAATKSKAAWYGTFEALKTAAHGPDWDVTAPPAAATTAAAAAVEAEERAMEKEAAKRWAAARASTRGAGTRVHRVSSHNGRKVQVGAALTRVAGAHQRGTVLHTPLKVMTRMVV